MTGLAVMDLQQFLTTQFSNFTADYVTGYYGNLTEDAVAEWQTSHGIVSSGTPQTTGYGAVGPKTAAAMRLCGGAGATTTFAAQGSASSDTTLLQSLMAQLHALEVQLATLSGASSTPASVSTSQEAPAFGERPPPPSFSTVESTATATPSTGFTPAVCNFNSIVIGSGESVTAYQSLTVPYGRQCVAQTRTCSSGVLSGSYAYVSCTPESTAASTFNGEAVANGTSVTSYNQSLPFGSQCTNSQLSCADGTLPNVSNYPYAALSIATQTYSMLPNPPQTLLIDSYDAYSPEPVDWNGGVRLYFGGWYTSADSPNDAIFVADCAGAGGPCKNVRKVIDPVATGWYQLNDPSIVLHPPTATSPAYYIMYMTCDSGPSGSDGICYSTSWATDGVNWSTPVLLTDSYWLPSATWKQDHVELFANEISPGRLVEFNLGPSGVAFGTPTIVQYDNPSSIPPLYENVNVQWRPSLNAYQILAERSVGGTASSPSVIDYLSSTDGVNWHLMYPSIISAQAGQYRVGTPAQNPDSAALVYFGSTPQTDSEGFKIYFAQWNPPTASASDQLSQLPNALSALQLAFNTLVQMR